MASVIGDSQAWQASYRSPTIGGAIKQALAFFVDDVDAHDTEPLLLSRKALALVTSLLGLVRDTALRRTNHEEESVVAFGG
ncbi:MAG: hypothetical protein SF187_29905 [Deltaproteobacteria bacterium]|nr:hypothetical protein [Deltaproteobacteria bacterium]